MCAARTPPRPSTRHFLALPVLVSVILALVSLLFLPGRAAAGEGPRLADPVLPAVDQQQTVLTVDRFGRYAVVARSRQGTALQLVDAMEGPGAIAGAAGDEDGRLDPFLDRGSYKLITHAHEQGSGQVELSARAFEELNTGLAPRLVDLKLVETSLGDVQQRSWWLELEREQRVILEAAGRHLADLRIWRDGTWLVDALPEIQVVEPSEGRPLLRCQLSVQLPAGLYLLSAYGGPGQPWSEESDEQPLYLRSGTPWLGAAGRQRGALSPFGQDRFLVPGGADFYRLELPEARPAALVVGDYDDSRPFNASGWSGRVQEESVPPVTELSVGTRSGSRLVSISGEAGQPYVLQQFPSTRSGVDVYSKQPRWLATLHAGSAADSLDPTVMLVRQPRNRSGAEVIAAQVIELGESVAFRRRFNLLQVSTLFLHVEQPGSYAVNLDDPKAAIRVEPFFVDRPAHYQPPEEQLGSSRWDLDAGYHVLTMAPHRVGAAELVIRPHGLLDSVLGAVGVERERSAAAGRAGAQLRGIRFDSDYEYSLYFNQVPGAQVGLVQRSLPIDLAQPLPVALQPGEELAVPARAAEAGNLRLEDDRGRLLEISVDGDAYMSLPGVDEGRCELLLRNPTDSPLLATLWLEPRRLQADTALPRVSMDTLAAIPDFPLLTESQPVYLDLERGSTATFRLRVDEPALYVLESTGLLATSGNLRTRTVLSLARTSQNGVGRNFMIQAYLGSGEYQVSLEAQGRSRGHLGLRLRRTELVDGGQLLEGVAARALVPAGDGISYSFELEDEARYRLAALGEGRGFSCRLEDGDGWPLERPGARLPAERWLQPGSYRLVLLPEAVDTRRVTSLERVEDRLSFEGHGPHALPLDRAVEHSWAEPAEGGERAPDRWRFDLPARAELVVDLSDEMVGEIRRVGSGQDAEPLGRVLPGPAWSGPLEAGRYELQARAARRDHGLPYGLRISSEQLLVGAERSVSAPARLEVAVGRARLVEIASAGDADVRARLLGAHGEVLASSDDRPEDWNFQLVERLAPGRYTLRIDPVGARQARTVVSMSAPPEREVPALAAGSSRELRPGSEVLLVPLQGLGHTELLAASARSTESVGLGIEVLRDGQWEPVVQDQGRSALALARLDDSQAWRLRIWSLDRRGGPVQLGVEALTPRRVGEARMSRGAELGAGRRALPTASALELALDRPGLLAVSGDPVSVCPAAGRACVPVENGLVSTAEPRLWLVAAMLTSAEPAQVQVQRVLLGGSGGEPSGPVVLGGSSVVLADLETGLAGPVLVEARSVVGQPGVRVLDWHNEPVDLEPADGMAVGERAAVAVTLDARDPAVLAWNAGDDTGGAARELRLWQRRFTAPLPEPAMPGAMDRALPAGAARAWILPAARGTLRLSLSKGLVAVLADGEQVLETWWAQDAPRNLATDCPARRLVVLNPGAQPGRVALDLLPAGAEAGVDLAFGDPLERRALRAGAFRLQLAGSGAEGEVLHLRGAVRSATLVDSEGRVRRGVDLPVPSDGGSVELEHDPGLLLAWVDRPGHEAAGLWGKVSAPWEVDLSTPQLAQLEGPAALLRMEPSTPVMLHLRAPQALVVGVQHAEAAMDVDVVPLADSVDIYLPGGSSAVSLRPLGGGELAGRVELTTSTVIPVAEGLGPELLLGPGDTRLFSFRVEQRGPVGLGVNADADALELSLLDARGGLLGRGLAQMPELDPGAYLLALTLPPQAAPLRVRPVVVGIELPDTGPPEDVVERFARLAGAEITPTGQEDQP